MNYRKFTVADFICDEHFQDWIIRPDEQTDDFWEKWQRSNPDKIDKINLAKKVLLNIKFQDDFPTTEQIQNALSKNLSLINAMEDVNNKGAKVISIKRLRKLRKLRKFVAILIGILIIGASVFYYNWRNATMTISTNYGEIKTMILPDGTEIVLNAHSSITYLKHWPGSVPREVQLQGEAFFKVTHLNKDENAIKDPQRFIVSTKDVKVEVLGTTFDVKNRRGKTNVILKKGKVRVAFNNKKNPEIAMLPGEMIVYDDTTHQVKKLNVDPEIQTGWINKKMILQDASVDTIAQYIEDNYGYKVILQDTGIGNKKMEGTLLLDNFKDVLFIMSTALDIKIEEKDSTLIFKNSRE